MKVGIGNGSLVRRIVIVNAEAFLAIGLDTGLTLCPHPGRVRLVLVHPTLHTGDGNTGHRMQRPLVHRADVVQRQADNLRPEAEGQRREHGIAASHFLAELEQPTFQMAPGVHWTGGGSKARS